MEVRLLRRASTLRTISGRGEALKLVVGALEAIGQFLKDAVAAVAEWALAALDGLIADGQAGSFDLAFLDADKENYGGYVERALELLRPGGLMLVDNVLWDGAVADPARQDDETNAIRALNSALHHDPRVTLSLVPVGDGLTLARKR